MAGNIKGITIEIDGNTTGLEASLKDVNKRSKDLQNELKQVEKALKLDPSNVELVRQKQELLTRSIAETSTKLNALKQAQSQVEQQFRNGDIGEEQYRAFQRELVSTEAQLRRFENQLQSVGGEQDKLSQNQRDLQTYLNATGQSVDDLSRTLGTRLTNAIKDGSASADQLELALNRIARQAGHSGEDLEQFRQTLRNADNGSPLDEIRQDLERIGQQAEETEKDMSALTDGVKTGALAASVAISAFGIGAGVAAAQFDNAIGQIQAGLGVTKEEAEELEAQARSVWKQGFGESLEEVASGLIRVSQNMKAIDGSEIEEVTKNALALAKAFESDVNEVTRSANNLMTNFGISAEQAFDMLAKGAQNGLNFSNELFDNVAEYAPLWADMGFSVEQMFGVLEAGVQSGVYNLDYLNDVMKEFQIRATDGSKSTTEAVSALGPEVEKVWQAFSNGKATVAEMSQSAVAELAKIDDKVKQNELGVALFGTKWEDLGGDVVLAMLATGQSMTDFEGAMNSVSEAQEKTFGQRWESFTRSAASSLEPIGRILLDLAEEWLPEITKGLTDATSWFANLSSGAKGAILLIGAIGAVIGPLIFMVGALIPVVTNIVGLLAAGGAAAGIFSSALTLLTGPVGIAIAAIAGIGIATLGISKELKKSSIEFEDWGEGVSATTASAVESFMELSDGAGQELMNLNITSSRVTDEIADSLTTKFNDMYTQIADSADAKHAEQLTSLQDFFLNSSALTTEEEQKIIEQTQRSHENEMEILAAKNARVAEIMATAAEEKRELTDHERQTIANINEQMKEDAIKTFSESELEQKVLLEKMKDNASELTALQAAEVVKNSTEQKEKVIAEANEQYDKTIAEIIKMRDESGVISAEQAEKMIGEAKKSRDQTIYLAEDMHNQVVGEAKQQAEEHVDQVNWETGEVKSKWQVMKDNVSSKMREMGSDIKVKWSEAWTDTKASVDNMKKSASDKFNEMKTDVSNKFQEIKSAMTKPINEAKGKISEAIENIKSFFANLSLKIPDIKLPKLPKFKLDGEFSLSPPSVPKLSVSWNALGGIFSKPTIFNTSAGLQGVGEAGPEAILPLNAETLANIGKGIAEQMGGNMPSTIVVQSILDGRVIAQSVTPFVSQNQRSNANMTALAKGVSLG